MTVRVARRDALNYQWFHNGEPIIGMVTPSLTLSNVQPLDAGSYMLAVSSSFTSNITELVEIVLLPHSLSGMIDFKLHTRLPESHGGFIALQAVGQSPGVWVLLGQFMEQAYPSHERVSSSMVPIRLLSDGSVDASFRAGGGNWRGVHGMQVQYPGAELLIAREVSEQQNTTSQALSA